MHMCVFALRTFEFIIVGEIYRQNDEKKSLKRSDVKRPDLPMYFLIILFR